MLRGMRGKRLIPRRRRATSTVGSVSGTGEFASASRLGRVRARRRRAPEVAKQELLDAAERVFLRNQPDQVGLKDIAREAGTSHALITHYFGTYAGLIEATLERRMHALREYIREQLRDSNMVANPEQLIAILFGALEDPVHMRLVRWLLASERPAAAHAFGLSANGIQLIAAQIASALVPNPTREVIDKVELAMITAVAAAYGYAIGKYALTGSAGKQPSRELDDKVQATLAQMVHAHIRAQLAEHNR
jgi:TetR/AcrR family transcriptional regulator, repressor for neighboring sulfatase